MLIIYLKEGIFSLDARTNKKEVQDMDLSSFKVTEELVKQQAMVYARRIGAYGAENVMLMEKFKLWANNHGYMTDEAVLLGIAQDDVNIVSPQQCRYDVVLLGNYDADEEWIASDIFPGGKYIVMEVPHTSEAVSLVWKEGIAFLSQQYRLDFSKPIIERYQKKLVVHHWCEMLFPVI